MILKQHCEIKYLCNTIELISHSQQCYHCLTFKSGMFIFLPRAFLFTLINSEGVPPSKFDVTHPKYATLHHPRCVNLVIHS